MKLYLAPLEGITGELQDMYTGRLTTHAMKMPTNILHHF